MKTETERIKERIRNICTRERNRLTRELEGLKKNLSDTMDVYGHGGACFRQEKAIEKREDMIQEIDDFEMQLRRQPRIIPARMYVYSCRNCGTVIMTSRQPTSEWHECPACRKMIRPGSIQSLDFHIADTGELWENTLEELRQASLADG